MICTLPPPPPFNVAQLPEPRMETLASVPPPPPAPKHRSFTYSYVSPKYRK